MTAAERLNNRLNSLSTAVVAALVFIAAAWTGDGEARVHHGLFYNIVTPYLDSTRLAAVPMIAAAVMVLLLNKAYDYVRVVTSLPATVLLLISLLTPATLGVGTATILPLAMAVMAIAVFEAFESDHAQRGAITVTALIGTGVIFDWSYAMLLLIIVPAYANSKALNWRTAVAMLLGLVAPAWIALALGAAHLRDAQVPALTPLWATPVHDAEAWTRLATLAVPTLLALVLMVVNAATTLNYRLILRVYNSYFHFAALAVPVAMTLDYTGAETYLPLAALVLGHEMALRQSLSRSPWGPVAVLTVTLAALALIYLPWKIS